jgi:hypothetical protein
MTIADISKPKRRFAVALFLSTSLSGLIAVQPAMSQDEDDAMRAFFSSGYTYCDAKLVGALWGMDPGQGKAEIGYKVIGGFPANLRRVFGESRANGNSCEWGDTGLSYSDAERLAAVWGLSTWDAKLKAADHYTHGRDYIVGNALGV